jgi:alpha-tubulin suppressor-like RCC1 family protein
VVQLKAFSLTNFIKFVKFIIVRVNISNMMNELLKFLPTVQIAACHHNLFLTEAGQVYVWGYNCFGQLGFISDGVSIPRPTLLPKSSLPEPIKMVAVGLYYSFALTVSGACMVGDTMKKVN